ncbi:MAG TPA: substrate-binding domain-containing protein, partial [Microbacterium sp.]|nr:substrate-binding domain-containing protein [Microbacterium sp.]
SLEQAKADGIKVVLFDTTTEDPAVAVSSVATDNPGVGAAGFEAMAKAHPEGGKVWVIGSAPGISTGDERLKGFEDAVAKNSAFEYVGVQYGGDDTAKSAQLTAAALQKDPDIVGIFGVSYKEAQGAVTAVKQAGLSDKITMVAVDSDPSQVEALEAGDFSALVAQDFESIGVKSVEQAVAAIEGKPVEKKIETGVHLITPENLSTPESQAAIYKSSC